MEGQRHQLTKGQGLAIELGAWIVAILLSAALSGLISWFFLASERHFAGVIDLLPAAIPEKFPVRSASAKSSVTDADRKRLIVTCLALRAAVPSADPVC